MEKYTIIKIFVIIYLINIIWFLKVTVKLSLDSSKKILTMDCLKRLRNQLKHWMACMFLQYQTVMKLLSLEIPLVLNKYIMQKMVARKHLPQK